MNRNRPDRRVIRRNEAEDRLLVWEKLSPHQQLEHLNIRLGKDLGAKKQRRRLTKKIGKEEVKS